MATVNFNDQHELSTKLRMQENNMWFNDALEYIIGEKAIYTVVNTRTGNRFTFKTKVGKNNKNFLNVYVLTGPNNTGNYSNMGYINKRTWEFDLSRFASMSREAQSFQVFQWVYNHLRSNTLPDFIKVYHYNRCCRCGRPLTVDTSIKIGIGPECMKLRAMGRR